VLDRLYKYTDSIMVFYYTLSDMFRPFYHGHLQASVLGGVVNTTVIHNIQDLVSRAKTVVYHYILVDVIIVTS
jgi:hypothetical protein